MPFSRDGKPIIGELNDIGLDGIWLLCGFGPHGIMEGPGAAKWIADKVINKLNNIEEKLDDKDLIQSIDSLRPNCVEIINK